MVRGGQEAPDRAGRLLAALRGPELFLTEGALVERLRRDPRLGLDPDVAHAGLLYTRGGVAALAALWRGYLDVGRAHGLPMLVATPTWRASPERLARARLPEVDRVSADAVALLSSLRQGSGTYGEAVFVGGLLGCRGDAYRPEEALEAVAAERFHAAQAEALARAGCDCLLAATLPALSEALGLARAMARTGSPYLVSFVLRASGTLLDGTPVTDAIEIIDAGVDPAPAAYLANCVHPETFGRALDAAERARPGVSRRLVGLQGNTSRLTPEELDGAAELDEDDPVAFATAAAAVRARFGTHVLGGCCGTDERHVAELARRCR